MHRLILPVAVLIFTALAAEGQVAGTPAAREAATLVEELRVVPTPLPQMGRFRSDGSVIPAEERREAIYSRLREIGPHAATALAGALRDPEVRMRRGAALALNVLSSTWWGGSTPPLDLRGCLPGLIAALADSDPRVRASVAQAIGNIGAEAASAVPALIGLLSNDDVGSRNSACIALAGVGPAAKDALPALRKALGDEDADVRRFAERAIGKIERGPADPRQVHSGLEDVAQRIAERG